MPLITASHKDCCTSGPILCNLLAPKACATLGVVAMMIPTTRIIMGNSELPPMDTPAKSTAEYCPAMMVSTTVELRCNNSAIRMGVASLMNLRHWLAERNVCETIDMKNSVKNLDAL